MFFPPEFGIVGSCLLFLFTRKEKEAKRKAAKVFDRQG
jgi:hypothetical protein